MTLEKLFNLCKPQFNHEPKAIYIVVLVQRLKEMTESRKVNINKTLRYLKGKKKVIP